jgi:hypothetical protein
MSKWILTLALASALGCDPASDPGFGLGSNTDDTTTDDSGPTGDGDCPPSFGTISAEIDEYPGKGWAVEVTAPFTEGTCSIADGSLFIEHDDGSGGTATEGPYDIGFEDEDVYVEDFDAEAGTGSLWFAFLVDSSVEQVIFTMWVSFGDGSASEHVEVTVN